MESEAFVWSDPQCTFRIEWAPEKLDRARIAVVDAFFCLPRGGIEIGGVLLGSFEKGLLRIADFVPMRCEHRTGPSFVLSANDEAALEAQLATLGTQAVGWFRSRTRTELSFSPQDCALHTRFFTEPWQVTMLLRPASMQPLRANYAFRDGTGTMAEGSAVFTVEPLRIPVGARPAKGAAAVSPPQPLPSLPSPSEPLISPLSAIAPPPAPPLFLRQLQPNQPKRSFLLPAVALAVCSLAVAAFFTREIWMGKPPEPLQLRASGLEGKLIVRWNPVQDAAPGELLIRDGGKNTEVKLDAGELRRGLYVHTRSSGSETVRLKVGMREESTSFAGPLPAPESAMEPKREQ